MTKLMRSSAEDEVLHRALRLPARTPGKIALADANGCGEIETKYMFESSEPIGEGGTAIVFKVRDTQLNVLRALKVLLVDLKSDPAANQRWRRESELLLALEKVDAPCVPTIYDVGLADGLPVIIMQFVDGVALTQKLSELNQLDALLSLNSNYLEKYLRFVVDVVRPLASSLAHIENHFAGTGNQGFAHGDLKPSNIVIEVRSTGSENGTSLEIEHVWLLDFGEASFRHVNEARGLTPDYSSPEQLANWAAHRSPQVTPATDQYQLGIVLQELLRPVESHGSLWHRWPRQLFVAWRIRHLSLTAGRMTARRPTDRFTDFRSVSSALERTESLPRQRIALLSAFAGILALLVVLFAFSSRAPADARDSRHADSQLATTAVENEWKRWQQPELVASHREQLEGQLAAIFEQWRSAYGKATADMIVEELRHRLDLLVGGQYELRVVSAQPDEYFKQSILENTADVVTVVLEVGSRMSAKLVGRVSPDQAVVFEQDQLTFSWQPRELLGLYIETKSPGERRRQVRVAATYEAAKASDGPAPLGPPPHIRLPIVWGDKAAGGGVMALPVNTRCTQFDGDSLSGQFNEQHIDWHVKIRRAK